MYSKSAEAKQEGWFSRRHKTNAAHLAAKAKREAKRDARRVREAASRAASRSSLTH